ncbi:DUF6344 domain-containing protein [Streptomyces sp. LP11]|uniref:DUF6344 domain-containing protein n=1 Tax=Streptomyces pyxinicus TaxID=2970331 RepID=A0ABT2B197_9ACTN|nr:DUF6344 domain-containing protein [Streptomyces sp. LP11]MCS0601728.1 DUF6344 domain-containing protein [Streptomyces sp. LP11]
MAKNKVMQLWTAIVTAFLALCTALGLVTATSATAAPAAPRTESPRTDGDKAHRPAPTIPTAFHWAWAHSRALPPTMKQRIRAEAHGKSPSCRHRPLDETQTENGREHTDGAEAAEVPAQRRSPAALDC